MSEYKVYLGDSVYADFDGHYVVLTTDNGFGPSNTIYLEPGALSSLFAYARRIAGASAQDLGVSDE